MDDNQKQRTSYPLRISDELRQHLERRAEQIGRSLHSEIVRRLEQSVGLIPEEAELSPLAETAQSRREQTDALAKQAMLQSMEKSSNTVGRESDKFMLRFPKGMRDRIADAAKANNRSMNAEIVNRLAQTFNEAESLPVAAGAFAVRLASIRAEQGMSQAELADRAGIAPAQLSRYETGRNVPRGEMIAKLAKALDVPLDALGLESFLEAEEGTPQQDRQIELMELMLEELKQIKDKL